MSNHQKNMVLTYSPISNVWNCSYCILITDNDHLNTFFNLKVKMELHCYFNLHFNDKLSSCLSENCISSVLLSLLYREEGLFFFLTFKPFNVILC